MRNQTAAPEQCHYFTLWIKWSSCINTHNVISDNCKKIGLECQLFIVQPVNKGFKGYSYRKIKLKELKAVPEMTITRPDTRWKTATPLTHSCSNDGVIQLGPLGSSSDAMFEVVKISDACFVHDLLQYAPLTVVDRI